MVQLRIPYECPCTRLQFHQSAIPCSNVYVAQTVFCNGFHTVGSTVGFSSFRVEKRYLVVEIVYYPVVFLIVKRQSSVGAYPHTSFFVGEECVDDALVVFWQVIGLECIPSLVETNESVACAEPQSSFFVFSYAEHSVVWQKLWRICVATICLHFVTIVAFKSSVGANPQQSLAVEEDTAVCFCMGCGHSGKHSEL